MKIEHIAIYTNKLEEMKDFFCSFLMGKSSAKYHNPKTGFSSYFVSFEEGARLEICNNANSNQQGLNGSNHIAFSLGSRENVDVLTQQLIAKGYTLCSGPRTTGDGYYESCLNVLDGVLIELTI